MSAHASRRQRPPAGGWDFPVKFTPMADAQKVNSFERGE
jgi:hypothetical protein